MTLQTLPEIVRTITQAQVDRYARATGDSNPIHVDADYAAASSYGRTIAHGMLVMALISEMMTAVFGEAWMRRGSLQVRFRAPVFPGDTITAFGVLRLSEDVQGSLKLAYTVGCRNERDDQVISGEATLSVPYSIDTHGMGS